MYAPSGLGVKRPDEVGLEQPEADVDHDRQRGEHARRELGLGGEGLDLAAERDALAHEGREVGEHLARLPPVSRWTSSDVTNMRASAVPMRSCSRSSAVRTSMPRRCSS
jgi:hypothetical protein